MIRFRNSSFTLAAVLGFILFFCGASHAGSGVTIERIEEATLDKLIKDRDNRLLVSFMAAWCGPCIEELPALNKLYRKYQNQGFHLIGISIDLAGPSAMQPIISQLKIDFPVYWCGEKAVNKFKLNAIPMLLFIKKGDIVERLQGKRPKEFLDKKIQELLQ